MKVNDNFLSKLFILQQDMSTNSALKDVSPPILHAKLLFLFTKNDGTSGSFGFLLFGKKNQNLLNKCTTAKPFASDLLIKVYPGTRFLA